MREVCYYKTFSRSVELERDRTVPRVLYILRFVWLGQADAGPTVLVYSED